MNLTKLTNKIVVPDIEYETESESVASIETGSQGSAATDGGWSTESVAGSDPLCRRSMTPPTPLDETEMSKKVRYLKSFAYNVQSYAMCNLCLYIHYTIIAFP